MQVALLSFALMGWQATAVQLSATQQTMPMVPTTEAPETTEALTGTDAETTAPADDESGTDSNPFSFNMEQIGEQLNTEAEAGAINDQAVIEGEAGQSIYKSKPYYDDHHPVYEDHPYDDHAFYGPSKHGGHHSSHDPHDDDCCSCHHGCGGCHEYDDYYDNCGVMESPNLVNMKLLKPRNKGTEGNLRKHQDNITVQSTASDDMASSVSNEVMAHNSCCTAVSCKKECGSGTTTKHFKIHGCITVNEEIERHEKSGEKTCNDSRAYRTMESMEVGEDVSEDDPREERGSGRGPPPGAPGQPGLPDIRELGPIDASNGQFKPNLGPYGPSPHPQGPSRSSDRYSPENRRGPTGGIHPVYEQYPYYDVSAVNPAALGDEAAEENENPEAAGSTSLEENSFMGPPSDSSLESQIGP